MNNLRKLLPALLLLAMLTTACRSRKNAVATTTTSTTTTTTVATTTTTDGTPEASAPQQQGCVTARLRIDLSAGSGTTSLGGTLRMKRDDVVQLSLITFGILEVARIELTPDYFLLIDKMGKQYVKAAYADVPALQGADFQTLQSFFWDENVPAYSGWQRSDYANVGQWSLPTRHVISIRPAGKNLKAELNLSNLSTDSQWEKRTQVPAKYREVPADELLSRIISLTK